MTTELMLRPTAYEQSLDLATKASAQLKADVLSKYMIDSDVEYVTEGAENALVLREQARILGTLHEGAGQALLNRLWLMYQTQGWRHLKGYHASSFVEWADADLQSSKSRKYEQALCHIIERVFTHIDANTIIVDTETGETASIESAIATLGIYYLKLLSSNYAEYLDNPAMKTKLLQTLWKSVGDGDDRTEAREDLKTVKLGGQAITLPACFVYELPDKHFHVRFDAVLNQEQYALFMGAFGRHLEIKLDAEKKEAIACLPEQTLDTSKQNQST